MHIAIQQYEWIKERREEGELKELDKIECRPVATFKQEQWQVVGLINTKNDSRVG